MRRRHAIVGFVLVAVAAGGCTGESSLVRVSGLVRLDGKPAEGVQVSFWPAEPGNKSRNRFALGITGKDGHFEARSISDKGIEPGEYKVTFARMVAAGKVIGDIKKKPDHAKQTLPERYTDQEKTDVTASVTRENHDFVFDLSSKPK